MSPLAPPVRHALLLALLAALAARASAGGSLPAAARPAGADCARREDCDFPFVCRRAAETDRLPRCWRPAKAGVFCERSGDCAGYGAFCIDAACEVPAGAAGDRCRSDDACVRGLVCHAGAPDGGDRVCRPRSRTRGFCESSAHCADDADACLAGACTPGSGQRLDRCVADRECKDGLVCSKAATNSDARRCRPPADTGAFCEESRHCASTADGCQGGVCVTGAARKRSGRRRVAGIVGGALGGVVVFIAVFVLLRRIHAGHRPPTTI